MTPLPVDLLDEFIFADPERGALTWKPRNRLHFKDDRSWKIWNTKNAGTPALNSLRQHGYLGGHVLKKYTYAHRAMWALVYGFWPGQIDHVDGDRTNNIIWNLRDVPQSLNTKNSAMRSDNKSGVRGVYWDKRRCKWVSRITVDGDVLWLGSFDDLADAQMSVEMARIKYGFSERHGLTV